MDIQLPDPTKPSTRVAEERVARAGRVGPSGIEDPTKISTSSTPAPTDDEVPAQPEEREAQNAYHE